MTIVFLLCLALIVVVATRTGQFPKQWRLVDLLTATTLAALLAWLARLEGLLPR